jgi:hypothetical protein
MKGKIIAVAKCYMTDGNCYQEAAREALRRLALATENGKLAELCKSKGVERSLVIQLLLEDEDVLPKLLDSKSK